jgi:hypothetical protein
MTMEYRVRVKTTRFDEPVLRRITPSEEEAWEHAATEVQGRQDRIVFIEKQYVSGWQPLGLKDSDIRRHYMTQAISGVEIQNSIYSTHLLIASTYEKALRQAKAEHPEVNWETANVKITLEVFDD